MEWLRGEQLKTVVLIMLVLLSLVLTYLLWYGSPPYEEAQIVFHESVFFEEPREIFEVIKPARLVIPVGEQENLLIKRGEENYRVVWDQAKKFLKGDWIEKRQVNLGDEPDEEPCLALYFEPAFPLKVDDTPSLAGLSKITHMKIFTDAERVILIAGEDDLVYEIEEEDFNGLNHLIDPIKMEKVEAIDLEEDDDNEAEAAETEGENEIEDDRDGDVESEEEVKLDLEEAYLHKVLEVEMVAGDFGEYEIEPAKNIYIPQGGKEVYSHLQLECEEISVDDFLEAVFVNRKLARTIEEPDGTMIFTDGEKGVRISNYMEYTAPKLEEGIATQPYDAAVQEANELISYYGGWPEKYYMDEIVRYNGSIIAGGDSYYYARWRSYHRGIPLVGNKAETEMKFNDRGLYYYQRALFSVAEQTGEKLEIEWNKEILSRAVEFYVEEFPDDNINNDKTIETLRLEDIFLAYKLEYTEDKGFATGYVVWVVKIEGEVIYLSIPDLTPFQEEEENEYL